MHKLRNIGVAESRSEKAGIHNEGLDSGIPGCSGHQLVSWRYLCILAWLKPWFLPNYQGNNFFLCLLRNFSVHPVHYSFTHSRSISWEAAVDWNLGFESILYHYLMSKLRQDTTSPGLYFTNLKSKFRMWSQWRQKTCLLAYFYIPSGRHRAWHIFGTPKCCCINRSQSALV